jgi:proline iminopeptidase
MSAVRMNFFVREEMIFDVTRQLASITTPTLIMGGQHDVQCHVSFSVEMNELIPQSTIYIFEESNHYHFLEEKRLFINVVNEFMKTKA